MKILLIYRNPTMGYSIGKVFRPIEEALREHCDVDSLYLPAEGYSPVNLLRNTLSLRSKLRNDSYDIVHITGTENYLLAALRNYPSVLTLHDIGSFERGCSALRRLLKRALFVDTIPLATHVTFISERSRSETLAQVALDPSRTSIVHNPVDPTYTPKPKAFNAACPTILHIGTAANKNLSRSVAALSGIRCNLRVVGRLTTPQREELNASTINYTSLQELTDDEMHREYERCDIVNFPSTYEGFGMPIIEGQAIGRVVVTSDTEPMRSVSGRGAYLVDPLDVESIRRGYVRITTNHDLRNRIIARGSANVRRYTTERICREYLALYEKIIRESKTH